MGLCHLSVFRRYCRVWGTHSGRAALKMCVGWATPVGSLLRERFGELGSCSDIEKGPEGRRLDLRLATTRLTRKVDNRLLFERVELSPKWVAQDGMLGQPPACRNLLHQARAPAGRITSRAHHPTRALYNVRISFRKIINKRGSIVSARGEAGAA